MGNDARTAIGAGVAGILVILSAVLEWIRLNSAGVAFAGGGVGGSARGLEIGFYGWAAMLLGATLLIGGFLWVTTTYRRLASPVVFLSGTGSLVLATFLFVSVESRFVDFVVGEAASADLPAAKIRALLGELFTQGSISVRPGIGLMWMALGGAVGVVAGIVGLVRKPTKTVVRLPEQQPQPRTRQPARQAGKGRFGF